MRLRCLPRLLEALDGPEYPSTCQSATESLPWAAEGFPHQHLL
jgi:hypothetical protein